MVKSSLLFSLWPLGSKVFEPHLKSIEAAPLIQVQDFLHKKEKGGKGKGKKKINV